MTDPIANDDYTSPSSVPGAVIDEKYRVDGVIGRGGVGLVVAATHLAINQRVAIKMIRDDVPMQRELLDRFHREARAAAMIRSDHVARVLDVGRLPTGRPYIVMEYLEGEDLEQVVARGPLPWMTAVDLSLQACEALAEAHRSGIVHRDLKPANLFLTRRPDGTPLLKVLDFGISKILPLTAERAARAAETTSIMGSPGYMAPEQMKSTRDVDARADVWSLGTVLYEMLVGRPAFEGDSMIEVLNAIAECSPPPPSHRQAGVPAGLDAVLARCLTKEPDARCPTIADLAMALQPFASPAAAVLADRALQISREPPLLLAEPNFAALRSEPPRPSAVTVITAARRNVSRTRRIALGLGGAAVLGVFVAFYTALSLRSSPGSQGHASAPPMAASEPPAPPAAAVAATASPWAVVSPPPWTSSSAAPPVASPRAGGHRPSRATPLPVAQPAEDSPFGDRK